MGDRTAKISVFFVFVMLIALLLVGCQLSQKGTENEVLTYLQSMGLRAKEIKDPVFVSGTEGFEGPPPETEEDVLARINSGILIQGTITKLEAVRIPAGGEVWYVVEATVRADEVLYGSAPDEIRISAAVAFDRKEEMKGVAPIPSLSGCREGASGLFLFTRKTNTACWWIINDIAVDAERIGEYNLLDRFDRKKNSLVTRDGNISIPLDELGTEALPKDDLTDVGPLIYESIQELVNAVKSERRSGQKDLAAQYNHLEDISVLYFPEADSIRVTEIRVDPNCISYYFTSLKQENTKKSSDNVFEVQINRDTSYSFLDFCKKLRIEPNADGFALWGGSNNNGPIYFLQDDTIITIIGPEGMNDYSTLRPFCKMERIDIPEE